MNGVLNLIAFIALLIVGIGHLISGWTRFGGFLLGLGILSLILGIGTSGSIAATFHLLPNKSYLTHRRPQKN